MSDEQMSAWEVAERSVALDHPWVRMIIDTLERDGVRKPYYYLESPADAVAVVALTGDGHMLLTRQYRHPVGAVIYDIPGGRSDPGEDPLEGARRELREETGYEAGHLELLGRINPFPGSLKVTMNLYFARDLAPGTQNLDEGEELEVHMLPFEDVFQGVLAGQYIDGALQTGVLMVRARGLA